MHRENKQQQQQKGPRLFENKQTKRDISPTNKPTRYSKLKVILLSKQGNNTRKNGTALQFAFTVL